MNPSRGRKVGLEHADPGSSGGECSAPLVLSGQSELTAEECRKLDSRG